MLGSVWILIAGIPTPTDGTAFTGRVNPSVYSIGAIAAMLCVFSCPTMQVATTTITDPIVGRRLADLGRWMEKMDVHGGNNTVSHACRSEKQVIR